MQTQLGRDPTQDEFAAEVQSQLGPRGFNARKRGLEKYPSPNLFTDEQLVVSAIISGIVRKHDICILTKDADVEEQFYKCAALLARQYEAMIIEITIPTNSDKLNFGPSSEQERLKGIYENDSFIECRLHRRDFRKLYPAIYHPIKILCMLIGGDNKTLKVTHIAFNAETEMAELLKLKSSPGSLNCDKFGDKNVRVNLFVDDPSNPVNVVHIVKKLGCNSGLLNSASQIHMTSSTNTNVLSITIRSSRESPVSQLGRSSFIFCSALPNHLSNLLLKHAIFAFDPRWAIRENKIGGCPPLREP